MSDRDAPPLAEERIVRALEAHGVEYVLVGGLGARARGAIRPTKDFDFCPAGSRDNLDRVAAVLRSLGARLRVEGLPEGYDVPYLDGEFLDQLELSTWRTTAGDIDVLKGIPAGTMSRLNRHPELLAAADAAEFVGCWIYVASLDHIILSKETTNRPPDREALPELHALRAAQLAQTADPTAGAVTDPEATPSVDVEAARAAELARTAFPEGIEAALDPAPAPSPPRGSAPRAKDVYDYRREPPGRSR